ncbi:hypothetical protein [Pseudomonas putida]|uniref:Uncharacterized protein n=1 Tax=Pseudomonas putida TaxID=303 RepID=A0A7V8EJ43_PSEPU|nr:hypothetical protein [Pseudomonas putida]KAF0255741.1 hypothetical protein GN299_06530 [Pseudomonas putida]
MSDTQQVVDRQIQATINATQPNLMQLLAVTVPAVAAFIFGSTHCSNEQRFPPASRWALLYCLSSLQTIRSITRIA